MAIMAWYKWAMNSPPHPPMTVLAALVIIYVVKMGYSKTTQGSQARQRWRNFGWSRS